MRPSFFFLGTILFALLFPTSVLRATQTENNVLHILPASGPVKIDGTTDGWDLSSGLFACDDVERTPSADKKGHVVEAVIPFSALGFTPQPGVKYRGDLGVTYGNEAGSRTRMRVYWSNQETGLVDDAIFELKMTPKNWGDIVFSK